MFNIWKKLKKAVNNYLDKLSKANEKSFGSEVPDCCKINKENIKK